jgi:hypothetical protein
VRRVGDDPAGEGGTGARRCSHGIVKMPALVVPPTQAASISTAAHARPRTTLIFRREKPPSLIFIRTF